MRQKGGLPGPPPRNPLDLRRRYATSFPPSQVNNSNKGSNGPAGSRSGKLHSEERARVTGRPRIPRRPGALVTVMLADVVPCVVRPDLLKKFFVIAFFEPHVQMMFPLYHLKLRTFLKWTIFHLVLPTKKQFAFSNREKEEGRVVMRNGDASAAEVGKSAALI